MTKANQLSRNTSTVQIMVQDLCDGTRSERVNAPYRKSDAQDDLEGVPHVSEDYGFLGEGIRRSCESCAGHPGTETQDDVGDADIGSDGKTPLQRLHGRIDNTPFLEFGEKILYMPAKPARG